MGSLGDYVIILPVVVAVINGVLAVVSTNYQFRTQKTKLRFIVAIVLFSIAAIGTTVYTQHLVIAERVAERARLTGIREGIGSLIAQGVALVEEMMDPEKRNQSPDRKKSDLWSEQTERFLAEKLGPSYVTRFRSAPHHFNPSGAPPFVAREYFREDVNLQLAKLEEFSHELPHQ